ncbi:hypothetical protein SAMN05421770_101837 [Granulicella rosea]|uniref:Transcriptional regulator, AbiEi antitoxin, Type IV TA system n=1 Tax=Granulicella rosea TaxID=474952 RepID=A0A239E799_9BACT|nr:type IV toxin-antitoxin system AbiEi family antitoxin [Granulicella rosea]SNS40536.1 hypothetical protein SAMN05421770_101837 [Granulicella rosea]
MNSRIELRGQGTLTEALGAVARTAALKLRHAVKTRTPGHGEVFLEADALATKPQFVAVIKTVRNFATIGMVKEQLNGLPPGVYPLLVAPYMTRALAERCRDLHLPFIDTAGNAFIQVPGLTIYITGEPQPARRKNDLERRRAYTEVGMKVIFALLCDQKLADATYREIGRVAQVALGTVGPVIKELANRGHLVQRGGIATLINTRELMEAWVARYPEALRPKLFQDRYQADVDRLQALDLHGRQAVWGAEVAAQRLTGYLKPEQFTLYVRGDAKSLLTKARMRLDQNGNTEILQAFWNLPEDPTHPDLVPPLLVYADLMATGDGRNLETARLLHEQLLEPLYRS